MKKSFYILLVLSLLILSSCNDKELSIKGIYINSIVFIEYSGSDGKNILKSDSQIEVFYDKNGIAEKVDHPNLTYPNGFTITTERNAQPYGSDELCIKVFPSNYYNEENLSTTYIKLGEYQIDTIRCQFYITSNKTWHNGTLVWDIDNNETSFPLINIIK